MIPKGMTTTKEEALSLQDEEYRALRDIMRGLTKDLSAAVNVSIIPNLREEHYSPTYPPLDWMSGPEYAEYRRTGRWTGITDVFYNEYDIYFRPYDRKELLIGYLHIDEMDYLVSKLKEFAQKYNKAIFFNFRDCISTPSHPDITISQRWYK
jgi:hypothetical protein